MSATDLAEVARVYRAAVDEGRPPGVAVRQLLRTSRGSASRAIRSCRDAGLLPAHDGDPKGTAYVGTHRPRTVSWTDQSESWLVCRSCRTLWPCAEAGES